MPRKKIESHVNHERWLVSYADFITLLFAFFVVMFATAQSDKGRAKEVSEAVKKALEEGAFSKVVANILGGAVDKKGQGNAQMRGPGGSRIVTKTAGEHHEGQVMELLPSLDSLTQTLGPEIKAGKVQIHMGSRGLVISFTQAALFPSGEDVIAADTYLSISKIAAAIVKIPNPVRLEGHTDAVPIHTPRFRNNWDLSAARSIALLEALAADGVNPDRLAIAGYAATAPLVPNDTEAGRQRNRRVDVVILNQTGIKGEPEKRKFTSEKGSS